MASLNKVQIIGRLGNDVDMRYTPSGSAVANMSVATSEKWKDQNGQNQERTTWHNITMFGKVAEVAGQYLVKGSLAYFEGKIVTEKYQDQQGNDKYTTKIYASTMQMLDSRQDQPQQRADQQQSPQQQRPQQNQQAAAPDYNEFDDDIPFAKHHSINGV
ncbi:single-stranded DNA-binding protein [Entomomonas moraniae]|uniref:Single-stranded DNA-binding protein n=1 Tax=Entomomonas moraniae TaxID=2213226 RepID=A0A3S9XE08_9GAMM|nr:single-stranded DNA-binding protein [Entomomonas moraniae]AZS50685.1 single-stranded DNA-binding protein [Entomomonas moraniae]